MSQRLHLALTYTEFVPFSQHLEIERFLMETRLPASFLKKLDSGITESEF